MYLTCYLKKGIVYIPTLGMMDKGGLFRDIEPVAFVPVFDTATLRSAILDNVARGHPSVSKVIGGDYGQPVVLKYAGYKSWSAFAKGTTPVSAQQSSGIYRIIGDKKRRDRGWEPDPEQTFELPVGSTLNDLCYRLIEFLQGLAAKT